MNVEVLPPSKLGTQEYWNSVYDREIDNYDQIGDEGEIWFGEEAVQRIVTFVEDAKEESVFPDSPTVLDLGTGNGHLLFELLDLSPPFTIPTQMLGIDYSKQSIELCNRIAKTRGKEYSQVSFQVVDFLCDVEDLEKKQWDLVCDKGTLDAIALSKASSDSSSDPVSQYVASLQKVCKPLTMFLITSCNFTEKELEKIFSEGFTVHHVVPTPSFSFGGQKGSTTTTIAFRRNAYIRV